MTTLRIPIESPNHWLRPTVSHIDGRVFIHDNDFPLDEPICAPHQPGDRLPVLEPLIGVIDTRLAPNEPMPICAYATGEHIWTKDAYREPWRWGDRTTIPAEEMPVEFARRWKVVESVGVECVEGVWEWVLTTKESE